MMDISLLIIIFVYYLIVDKIIIALPVNKDQLLLNNKYTVNIQYFKDGIRNLPYYDREIVKEWNNNTQVNNNFPIIADSKANDVIFSGVLSDSGSIVEWSRWPNGQIPYVITGYYTNDEYQTIMSAINEFHKYTCVRFVPYNGQSVYIRITSGWNGCYSYIGYNKNSYDINLERPMCVTSKGTVLHELMHAVGFLHEHTRSDRDKYISIQWNNIQNDAKQYFKKDSSSNNDIYGFPYDYKSVMHYTSNTFTKNGRDTIIPKKNRNIALIQRNKLSHYDIMKINTIYDCVPQQQQQRQQEKNYVKKQKYSKKRKNQKRLKASNGPKITLKYNWN